MTEEERMELELEECVNENTRLLVRIQELNNEKQRKSEVQASLFVITGLLLVFCLVIYLNGLKKEPTTEAKGEHHLIEALLKE
jgi:hypothetical protein